jgi:hypothetical protein
MTDAQFLTTLNAITQEHRLKLPLLSADKTPTSDDVAAWANCLQLCIKKGISLSDPRWKRVRVGRTTKTCTIFELEETAEQEPDEDFKVGLQLLMGMMDQVE